MPEDWCRARRRRGGPAFAGFAAAALLAPACGHAQNVTYSEVELGVLSHDVHFLGGKEDGVDLNPELILAAPITDAAAGEVPAVLRWLVQPRPTVGLDVNTAGQTDQAYVGATWTWQLAGNVFRAGDGVTVGYFFGSSFNNGEIHATQSDRKSLGANVLFREAIELGYRITPVYEVSLHFDHVSNAGLAQYNQSINDLGARLGIRF